MSYGTTLALTVAIEAPLAAITAGRLRRGRATLASIALNLVTHPLAYMMVRDALLPWGFVELLVALSEAAGYYAAARLSPLRALLVSGACNVSSAGVALLLGP